MAQTRKRRRTKHRGNAAGIVEARGRTGRKPTGSERGGQLRSQARARRQTRLDRPPTWRGALNRAAIAAVVFIVLLVLLFKQPIGSAIGLGGFVLLFYIPMGYYTDLFIYRRRQQKKSDQGGRSS
jgi:hypothetical protein